MTPDSKAIKAAATTPWPDTLLNQASNKQG